MRVIKNLVEISKKSLLFPLFCLDSILDIRDLLIAKQAESRKILHPNPLNKFGKKFFSQSDEDGILLEILKRLRINGGFFFEFGVGNGTENNTLILASLGWKGVWVGGEDLAFKYSPSSKFLYIKTWITLENIMLSIRSGLTFFKKSDIDLISVDLDGNDFYFVEVMLKNKINPKVFIVEYNGAFPPPVEFKIKYNPTHRWSKDNYYGASLMSYVKLFRKFNYSLVCCNSHTGANAFFIKDEYLSLFKEVPKSIDEIYVAPSYFLYKKYGHKISTKTIEMFLRE